MRTTLRVLTLTTVTTLFSACSIENESDIQTIVIGPEDPNAPASVQTQLREGQIRSLVDEAGFELRAHKQEGRYTLTLPKNEAASQLLENIERTGWKAEEATNTDAPENQPAPESALK